VKVALETPVFVRPLLPGCTNFTQPIAPNLPSGIEGSFLARCQRADRNSRGPATMYFDHRSKPATGVDAAATYPDARR
jgi:hypothetical protein